MSIWQKIVTGSKFLFGGFEAATDYILNAVLNPYLQTDAVAANVRKAYNAANSVLRGLEKYRKFCPWGWLAQYDATINAVSVMVTAFEDNTISREEIQAVVEAVSTAKAEYMRD